MPTSKNLIPEKLTASMVREYIDFDGIDAVAPEAASAQAKLQSAGVAGLWHLLESKGFAYLCDEVGMGKTRQAMGIIATQFLRKPDSRVVIICSSATLQRQWQSEWSEFLRTCYKLLDGRLLDETNGRQLETLHFHGNLRDFVAALRLGEARIHLLRYSSLRRPLNLQGDSPEAILQDYANLVGVDGVERLSDEERKIAQAHAKPSQTSREDITHALSEEYCKRIGALMTCGRIGDEPVQPLDLAIFDEAQYLRHTDNYQNSHIAGIFRRNVHRWLFMSATPLHSSAGDIRSLDAYLCRLPSRLNAEGKSAIPGACGDCSHKARCSRATWTLDPKLGLKVDVIDLLAEMMVRRTRTYADSQHQRYGKIEYRKYERVRYTGADDPFLSLTMALVQKRLVGVLAGKQNRFRQGECASFESLSTSVRRSEASRKAFVAKDTVEREYETALDRKQAGADDKANRAMDRTVIDELNHSFVKAMNGRTGAERPGQHAMALPHAKLNRTAEALFERSLKDGAGDKTLVFVRRIDTVEEIRDLLHVQFQRQVDRRIEAWETLAGLDAFGGKGNPGMTPDAFWASRLAEDDSHDANEGEDAPSDSLDGNDDDEDDEDGENGETFRASEFREAIALPYFDALKRASGERKQNGKLVSFIQRLLSATLPSQKPLRGFLLRRPEEPTGTEEQNERIWRKNAERWARFLDIVLGAARIDALRVDPRNKWLFDDTDEPADAGWKRAALQRCILQSMRQTDFIVDLYVLHSRVARTPDNATELPEKLLWLLEHAGDPVLGELSVYVANWKEKFRRWIEHFDLIVDKCLRGGDATDWKGICEEEINRAFSLMSPVIGRSSRLKNQNAVRQFKFPTHPNVLICTDVLKEGVDMHLFCDSVVHYGVAWTSGDLEQRIGRVDRLGSLIGRRIEQYARAEQAGGPAELPRLGVAFPYLDGTLDRYQVDRIIRAKITSDLRMDLGKRKDEMGEVDVASLEADERVFLTAAGNSASDEPFFPESARFVMNDEASVPLMLPTNLRDGQAERGSPREAGTVGEGQYLTAIDAVRVRRHVDSQSPLLRVVPGEDNGARKKGKASRKETAVRRTEEVLVPCASNQGGTTAASADRAGSPAAELCITVPAGVRSVHGHGFAIDDKLKTLTCTADVSFALAAAGPMSGKALLESIGDTLWLLRAAVCDAWDEKNKLDDTLAGHNAMRQWGYLMKDAGIIWLAAVVQKSAGDEWHLLTRLAADIARAALHYRRVLPVSADDKVKSFRSRSAFPSLIAFSSPRSNPAMRLSALAGQFTNNTLPNMQNDDLLACGQMLAGVRTWFSEAFQAVLDSLHEASGDSAERKLAVAPLAFLENGLLHLRTTGKQRYSLQGYLDLSGVIAGKGVMDGPKLVWELTASPIQSGRFPTLEHSGLEQLPHALPDIWEGQPADGYGAFTCKDDRYRYLALYHEPAFWDSARDELLGAWQVALGKMQSSPNFLRQSCRDAFLEAMIAQRIAA
ncbi:helicase-related protein [Cupriavidus sp. CuC1]|uniref:DEAD/DEAH box helicase family protein n=1 Tax=Cupriavidus sp. CuC1 TaxID=3373131 RepID=UPI0037D8442E